jgi:uncharacterized membrane protein YtjA (UPF0391 family)
MLRVAAVFLVMAVIAALFGFGSTLGISWEDARILFFVFAVLTVLSAVAAAYRGRGVLT